MTTPISGASAQVITQANLQTLMRGGITHQNGGQTYDGNSGTVIRTDSFIDSFTRQVGDTFLYQRLEGSVRGAVPLSEIPTVETEAISFKVDATTREIIVVPAADETMTDEELDAQEEIIAARIDPEAVVDEFFEEGFIDIDKLREAFDQINP